MKYLKNILAILTTAFILMVSSTNPVAALGGWVDHKFMLERPDGTKMDLKGAKMHVYHRTKEGGFTNINSFCAYPDKDSDFAKYVDSDNDPDDITDEDDKLFEYHCLTPQSCSNSDFGAPYLPKSFNSTESIYNKGNGSDAADASYRAFHSTNFTGALTGNVAYLASMYKEGNIRGFEGAKWEMNLDWKAGSGVTKATQSEINGIRTMDGGAGANWGNIPGIDGRQDWSEGEVYKDTDGENQLHARITWVLKPPAQPLEKPTASLAGKCATTNPGVPSYSYTLSNIDLKGANFKSSHLHFNVNKGAWTDEFKQQFGPPIYENASIMSYSLIFTTTAPTNNTITWTVLPTEGVGNQTSNTKTVADLVKWVDGKVAAGVTIPFEIKTNLESEKDGKTILNDSITVAANGFKPKFVTNECGTPPVSPPPSSPPPMGGAPACVSVVLQYADAARAGQRVDMSQIKIGDSLKAVCGQVPNVQYAFRVYTPNSTTPIVSQPSTSNSSVALTVDQPGKFYVQCALCVDGQCHFEPAPF